MITLRQMEEVGFMLVVKHLSSRINHLLPPYLHEFFLPLCLCLPPQNCIFNTFFNLHAYTLAVILFIPFYRYLKIITGVEKVYLLVVRIISCAKNLGDGHMNSCRKPAVWVIIVNGKKFKRNCFCCPLVLLGDDEHGDSQGYNTRSRMCEGGGE